MLKFFKKKKTGLLNRIEYISENPNMNFQLNLYKGENLDLQMTRISSLKKFNVEINNNYLKDDIVYLLNFSSKRDLIDSNEKRFVESSLSKESTKVDVLGDSYLLFSKNDKKSITDKINQIGKEIYGYDYNESGVNFNIIE